MYHLNGYSACQCLSDGDIEARPAERHVLAAAAAAWSSECRSARQTSNQL